MFAKQMLFFYFVKINSLVYNIYSVYLLLIKNLQKVRCNLIDKYGHFFGPDAYGSKTKIPTLMINAESVTSFISFSFRKIQL